MRQGNAEQADAELLDRAGELTELKVEHLAAIADQGDEAAARREMPDSGGWTERERCEQIARWRCGRRDMALLPRPRPGEDGDDWRERIVADRQERGLGLPYVIPASCREDVVEVDLTTLRRRDRRRLFRPGGVRSQRHARAVTLQVLRGVGVARRTPACRAVAKRPRRSARRASTRGSPDDGSGEPDPADGLAPDRRRSTIQGGSA